MSQKKQRKSKKNQSRNDNIIKDRKSQKINRQRKKNKER
jgi:hypothetical protein